MSRAELALPAEQRFRLSLVSWEGYEHLGKAFADRRVRMTYDRGEVEIMTVSFGHENDSAFLGWLVRTLVEEMGMAARNGRTTTLSRPDLERGLESDDCWWIQNVAAVRGVRAIDLAIHPPPDLSLEVEITRSVLDRVGIYAALGVPELWRWNGETLTVWVLRRDGTYREVKKSRAFTFLTVAELVHFLRMAADDEMQAGREFRSWVRAHAEAWKTEAAGRRRRS